MLHRKAPFIILILALVFFFIYTFSYPRTSSFDSLYGFENPGNNLFSVFSKQYAETGSFKYPVPYQGQLPRDIELAFTPRDAAQYNGYIVPKFFLGSLLCWGTIASIDKDILLIITPLTAVFMVIALYLIVRKFFGEKIALLTSAIAFVFPVSLWWGAQLLTDAFISLLFLLLGLYYFVKLSESRERKYYFLSALFLANALFHRYEWLFLILPLLIYAIFIKRGMAWNKRSLIVVGTAAFSLVPILLLNKELYGDFLVTGYQVEADMVAEITGLTGMSYIIGFEPEFISRYVGMYIIEFVPLLTLGFILGLFVRFRDKEKSRYLALYALYVIIISSVYYGSDVTWGFDTYQVNATFTRHLLPGYLLAMPFLAVVIDKVKGMNKIIWLSLVSIIVATGVVTAFVGPNGIAERNERILDYREFHDAVIEKTEPNSIIIARYYDKILLPDRDVLNVTYLAFPTSRELDPEEFRPWEVPPDLYLLGHRAAYIANQGIPVYITEVGTNDLDALKEVLFQEGYTIESLGVNPNKDVYKIVPK